MNLRHAPFSPMSLPGQVARVVQPAIIMRSFRFLSPAPAARDADWIVRATHGLRRGFALIEVLVALMLLTVILGIGAIAYRDVMSLSRDQGRYQQRRASAEYFLSQFAKDVRGAQAIEQATTQSLRTSELTLKLPDGAEVAYSPQGRALQRVVMSPSAKDQPMLMISDPGMTVRFDVEPRSVVATVEWEEPPQIGVSHPILSLRVALRGQP
jgi:prepilin-type N-terminal cleavage/methylation domain-containing protein